MEIAGRGYEDGAMRRDKKDETEWRAGGRASRRLTNRVRRGETNSRDKAPALSTPTSLACRSLVFAQRITRVVLASYLHSLLAAGVRCARVALASARTKGRVETHLLRKARAHKKRHHQF